MRDLDNDAGRELAARILEALQGIRFGSLEIVIHDSKVVQIGAQGEAQAGRRGD